MTKSQGSLTSSGAMKALCHSLCASLVFGVTFFLLHVGGKSMGATTALMTKCNCKRVIYLNEMFTKAPEESIGSF